jgi:hypothetical protein
MWSWQSVLDRYEDADRWRVADVRSYREPHDEVRLDLLLHLEEGGAVVGFSVEQDVPVEPATPYVVWDSRDDAIAYLLRFIAQYENSHDTWTSDIVSLLHVKNESDIDVIFHAGLTGNLPPQEEKWGL